MYLNELPELVLIKIFKNCSLNELIKNRVICKLWKYRIDKIIEANDEIILFFEAPIESGKCWTFNEEPINLNRSLSVNQHIFLEGTDLTFFKNNNIKKLFFYIYKINENISEKLFLFINLYFKDQLDHLEINFSFPQPMQNIPSCRKKIDLKNLKSFSRTSSFIPYDYYDFEFKNIEQLKIDLLEIDENSSKWFENLRYFSGHLSRIDPNFVFSKLEILQVPNYDLSNRIQIEMFPSLKELQLISVDDDDELDFYLKEKINQNKKNLKIYANGFECTDEFKDFLSKNPGFFHSNFRGYNHLDHLNFIKDHPSNYKFGLDHWVDCLSDGLIEWLNEIEIEHRKKLILDMNFIHIEEQLKLEQLKDGLIFDSCAHLNIFFISQSILNLTPSYFPNTKIINFQINYGVPINKKIDFSFIANFKKLKSIEFQQIDIPLLELKKIIENCNYIESITFQNIVIFINYHLKLKIHLCIQKKTIEFDSKLSLLNYLTNNISTNRIEEKRSQSDCCRLF